MELVLSAVALGVGTLALLVAGVTYYASRAAHVRAFDARVEESLQNAQRRIENMEARTMEWRAALETIMGDYETLTERTKKERVRVEAANRRADMLGQGDGPDADPMPDAADRAAQLRWVDRQLAKRGGV